MHEQGVYARYVKGVLDRALGLLGLLLLSWLLVLLALLVFIDDPGPVIFRQKRVGRKKNGELTYFTILKFRTMRRSAPPDVPTHLMVDAERYLTPVGRWLRNSSLDELPQLWNIAVSHDLSVVGPRPALWNQEDLIAEREKYGANDVMPGLTGWAQINGRDELGIAEKARRDGEYAEKLSFALDAKCFFATFSAVIRAEGVAGCGERTRRGQGDKRLL